VCHVQVILIKIADRLHNMRTVFVLKPEKQVAVAEETLEVWCTMAECLGWDAMKVREDVGQQLNY
jgi:guanosine-3',5'-bis(diphosphate) 3'-pyrophosphohydrolase